MPLDDAQLLNDYAKGSEAAFAELYRRHANWILAVARRQVKDSELAKDVTQAVFILLSRKASSLHITSTLGPWLFGTTRLTSKAALRMEDRHKRLAQEAAMHMSQVTAPEDIWKQLAPELDDLVDDLRPTDREAILLRFYEQKSHEEVGTALGLSKEAARKRIDRALQQLQGLFARRGVILGAAGIGEAILLFGREPASAAASTASIAVSQLIKQATLHGGGRAMNIASATKLSVWAGTTAKIAATVAGITIVGGIAAGTHLLGKDTSAPGTPPAQPFAIAVAAPNAQPIATLSNNTTVAANVTTPSAQPATPAQVAPGAAQVANADEIRVHGIVLDPQGKPVAGAKVFAAAAWNLWDKEIKREPLAQTTSGADGHFEIAFSKSKASPFSLTGGVTGADMWKNVRIVATSEGLGLAFATCNQTDAKGDVVLNLLPDNVPIEGRVVDADNKPVPNVKIIVDMAGPYSMDGGKDQGEGFPKFLTLPRIAAGLPEPIVTDAMGRFRMSGMGRDRVVYLQLSSPTIGYARISVATKYMEPVITAIDNPTGRKTYYTTYGAKFEFKAHPAQALTGTITDAATKAPVAGVRVTSLWFAGPDFGLGPEGCVESITDAQGHYKLQGLPAGKGNRIGVIPDDKQPYFMQQIEVAEAAAGETKSLDIQLHEGVWITGKVTDKSTSAPVAARLEYSPLKSNRIARTLPEYEYGITTGTSLGIQNQWFTKSDGTYKLAAVPGESVIGVIASEEKYFKGAVAEGIPQRKDGLIDTYGPCQYPDMLNAIKAVNIPQGGAGATVDFQLDAGQSMHVTIIDPDGKPAANVHVRGQTPENYGVWDGWVDKVEATGEFDAVGFNASDVRTLLVRDLPRGLGKVMNVRLADAKDGKLTVKLEALSKLTGRLVDQQNKPVADVVVQAGAEPTDGRRQLPVVKTDANGKFSYTLLPGCDYTFCAQGQVIHDFFEVISREIKVAPGATRDLGDIKVKTQPAPAEKVRGKGPRNK